MHSGCNELHANHTASLEASFLELFIVGVQCAQAAVQRVQGASGSECQQHRDSESSQGRSAERQQRVRLKFPEDSSTLVVLSQMRICEYADTRIYGEYTRIYGEDTTIYHLQCGHILIPSNLPITYLSCS